MSKKVLILSSSPRRGGNSDVLCEEFMKGAKDSGNSVQKIFLKDKEINFCTGCGACNSTHACVLKDSMAEIIELMIASDVIVMATPVYFYTMCGQMKTFIDRCCPAYTKISDKEFYFIATAADGRSQAVERVLEEFGGFLACLNGAKVKGFIKGVGAWQIGDIKNTGALKEAYNLGKKIV